MRIRVTLDVTKLLLRKKKLTIGLPELVWVNFKYEWLSDFCFCCGVLGHGQKESKTWLKALEVFVKEGLSYRASLWVGFNGGHSGLVKHQTHRSSTPTP